MIEFPKTIKTDEDKVQFLYRAIELLRLEHNEWGKAFREGRLSEKEFRDYQKNDFRPRNLKLFEMLNPIKDKLGMFNLYPITNPDDPRLLLKESGKTETKWDISINIQQI